ncbi:phage tail protein X [Leptospira interrogans str. 2003000735]|uniref:Phage tail protein X n=2 Tax=Leptospira interrogans TaxID=173 RepID=A0A829DB71_LEPIR|nr:tail protein X [Leptospira interrogans]EMY06275.1 phage tail protein X [Leptospira interrogans str. 2002000626]EMY25680.1 phage tail protein X [Leptospira interrogans serovar Australis str. 200703203]EKN89839.1 phage tail protein X [Leptospira interrogans str. 2002000624]EKQ40374.1 phage tail protein X [Leptospira interrogans str. 2002000621]EKQ46061.1 phage tail protein X [Leptospira interrogans str. 2002000623]
MNAFYVLKPNDTLQRLAARFYGRWEIWRLIFDSNPHLESWKSLPIGIQIEIPIPRTDDTNHTILEGDTYESLSLSYYGTEHFSGRIREANENLQPYENIGSELFVPSLIEKSDLVNAKRRSM